MIECTGVSYQYPNGQGIHNIDIYIPGTSIYLLAGMNGSGKSTLLKVLAGGLKTYSGIITVNGLDVKEPRTKEKRLFSVALSPQQPETQFSLPTVRDELRFTAQATKQPVDIDLETQLLEILQLSPYMDSSPFDLPPVKRKLLSLAIAAVIPSPFIALDEPTAGIDRDHKPMVLQFIRFLYTHDKGVIIVSHDIDTFLPLATHVGIMSGGRMIESIERNDFLEKFMRGEYEREIARPFIIPRMARYLIKKPAASIDELAGIITHSGTQE